MQSSPLVIETLHLSSLVHPWKFHGTPGVSYNSSPPLNSVPTESLFFTQWPLLTSQTHHHYSVTCYRSQQLETPKINMYTFFLLLQRCFLDGAASKVNEREREREGWGSWTPKSNPYLLIHQIPGQSVQRIGLATYHKAHHHHQRYYLVVATNLAKLKLAPFQQNL